MDPATVSESMVAAAIANVAFACAVGTCLAVLMLGNAPPLVRHRLQRFAAGCAVTLILADAANLLLEAALMSGSAPDAAFTSLVPVVTQSHFGMAWSIRFVALIVWTGLLLRARQGGRATRMGVALFAAALFAFSKAASSHAADAGDFSLPEWIRWAHLCATATWAGLVIASGLWVLPTLRASPTGDVVTQYATRLSRAALIAVSVVLVSGIYNAERGLGGSLSALAVSGWGIILDVKLVLVGTAIVLGGINRLVYLPRMQRVEERCAADSFLAILRAEAVTMVGVLSAAAVLAHSAPGAHLGAGP